MNRFAKTKATRSNTSEDRGVSEGREDSAAQVDSFAIHRHQFFEDVGDASRCAGRPRMTATEMIGHVLSGGFPALCRESCHDRVQLPGVSIALANRRWGISSAVARSPALSGRSEEVRSTTVSRSWLVSCLASRGIEWFVGRFGRFMARCCGLVDEDGVNDRLTTRSFFK